MNGHDDLALRLRDSYRGAAVAPLRDGLYTRAILVELRRCRMVGGQEDMIVDGALDLAAAKHR